MKKPAILSLGAMACVLLVVAVPAYNNMQLGTMTLGSPGENNPIAGKHWQCVTQSGPDAPNLIILRENGRFLKLIDYRKVVDNGTNYDLQGMFDIQHDKLLARVSGISGEIYTDTYTVSRMDGGKMQMIRTGNTDTENTRYTCNMQASRT